MLRCQGQSFTFPVKYEISEAFYINLRENRRGNQKWTIQGH